MSSAGISATSIAHHSRDLFSQRPEDLPNRFLTWGVFSLPWKLRVYPLVEYRTGSPYAVVDAEKKVRIPVAVAVRNAHIISPAASTTA